MRQVLGGFLLLVGAVTLAVGLAAVVATQLNRPLRVRIGVASQPFDVPPGPELAIMLGVSAGLFVLVGAALRSDRLAALVRRHPVPSLAVAAAATFVIGVAGSRFYLWAQDGPAFLAAQRNDVRALEEALAAEPPDRELANRLLHRAITQRSSDVVRLLAPRADLLWQRGEALSSHLEDACHWGDIESIRVLLAAGAPVNYQNKHKHTALMTAVLYREGSEQEKIEIVKLLLEHGADRSLRNFQGDRAEDLARQLGLKRLEAELRGRGRHR